MPSPFLRLFSPDRPAWRDAWRWSLPALAVGILVRLWLLHLLPHAFYGLDSFSYFAFPDSLMRGHRHWDYPDNRRWLFPLLLTPAYLAGIKPLASILVMQKVFALLTIPPLAYAIRKTFRFWRVFVVPATLLWTVLPLNWNFEQQLTGHVFMVGLVMWSLAGWCSWAAFPGRSALRWHAFFLPLGLAMLTKPVVWFLLPGLALGLVLTGHWRRLSFAYLPLLLAVLVAMKFAGSDLTKYRHLLNTAFPLIRLETPLRAEYKREVVDFVHSTRSALDHYYLADEGPHKAIIEDPAFDPVNRPMWADLLAGNTGAAKRKAVWSDLAWEGIHHEPWMLLYIATQRSVFLLRQGFPAEELSGVRDDPAGLRRMMAEDVPARPERVKVLRRLFELDPAQPVPSGEIVYATHYGGMRTPEAAALFRYCNTLGSSLRTITLRDGAPQDAPISAHRPTVIGLLLLAGLFVGAFGRHRSLLLPWSVAWFAFMLGSLMLISGVPLRQISPALPLLLFFPWLALDALASFVADRASSSR